MSQSPQTGQVYFNGEKDENRYFVSQSCLNPLKRVKFISMVVRDQDSIDRLTVSLNPLKRVKFISIKKFKTRPKSEPNYVSIPSNGSSLFQCRYFMFPTHFGTLVSIPSNGSSLFQYRVYFDPISSSRLSLNPLKRVKFISIISRKFPVSYQLAKSQSPQTGQVYFNRSGYSCI